MTLETRRRKALSPERAPLRAEAPAQRVLDRLRQRGSVVSLRRGQALPLLPAAQSCSFILEGVVVVATGEDARNRHALRLLYPGELLTADSLPRIEGITAIAASRASILRLARERLNDTAGADPELANLLATSEARSAARQTLHVARLATLSAEERLSSLMFELAIALADRAGAPFELPLSRREMAAYLGINADTLSRLMSRLKARGLVTFSGRSRASVANPDRLAGTSPLASSIRAVQADAAF